MTLNPQVHPGHDPDPRLHVEPLALQVILIAHQLLVRPLDALGTTPEWLQLPDDMVEETEQKIHKSAFFFNFCCRVTSLLGALSLLFVIVGWQNQNCD